MNLRLEDVDLKEGRLYVYQTKGNKGHVVLFPACLREPIERRTRLAEALAHRQSSPGVVGHLPSLGATARPEEG